MSVQDLQNQRILLIEDNSLIADFLATTLEDRGAIVLGPFQWIDEALSFVENNAASIDVAVLDINLHDQESYPIADLLIQNRIKFMFISGLGHTAIRQAYLDFPSCEKPFREEEFISKLLQLLTGS
jgi:DNA-binding response OmpR family regulator